MESKTDIEKYDDRHPETKDVVVQEPNAVLLMAMQKDYTPELIEKMMDLQDRHEKNEARKAFYAAVANFKENIPPVVKDKINKHTNNSPYASAGNLMGTMNPILAKSGLSVNYKIDDKTNPELITVGAVLSHAAGHSDTVEMSSPPDMKGAQGTVNKTEIHGRLSTLTYLMKATFSAVVGFAAMDSKFDDDGNLAGGTVEEFITKDQAKDLNALIESCGDKAIWTVDKILKLNQIDSLDDLPAKEVKKVMKWINDTVKKAKP